ncbi:MAG: hypothetical protein Q9Q40_02655 [Acidobacteriota bacterium]|nr:hypothetical protein [Acidobacteriota bacterium]MDQ7088040.1 hypothetical protein [Acidobacteriota bacterium]
MKSSHPLEKGIPHPLIRVLTLVVLIALAGAPGRAGEVPRASEGSGWDFLSTLDHDERALIEGYAAQARQLQRMALELARRYPGPLLELQVRRDLRRLRWRTAGPWAGRWSEALVCPEDRRAFRQVEGVTAESSARGEWIRLALRGDRLLSAPGWAGHALLIRPDGTLVRLMRLE